MEIKQDEFELFMQFKQFMAMQGTSTNVPAKPKKKRREKGTGSITKLSGSRKRPYMATWTTGYNDEDEGQQMQVPLAYFKEYEQANRALDLYMLEKTGRCAVGTVSEYIYNVDGKLSKNTTLIAQNAHASEFIGKEEKIKSCPTFEEVWGIIYLTDIGNLANNTIINYKTAFKKLKQLHKLRIDDISLHDIQPIFDKEMEIGSGISKLNNMKNVISKILNYGLKYDYVKKDYSKFISIHDTSKNKNQRIPFTEDEVILLKNDDSYEAKVVLVYIYTGMRPQELCNIKWNDVHLNEKYMIGGIKTENGVNRNIPLHNEIIPYIKEIMKINGEKQFVLGDRNGRNGTEYYRRTIFKPLMKKLKLKHDPYDTRHTFATLSKVYGVNDYARKKIMGHSCKDLTDDVYTHSPIDFLLKEVNKIKL